MVRDVRITINSADWAALKQNFKENIYYPCSIQVLGVTYHNVGIRSRGLGSRSETKPGLRVDADRYAVDQTIAGLKSFVLDNLVQDPSMLKERLTMAFFRRMGLARAARSARASLYQQPVLRAVCRRRGDRQGVCRSDVRRGQSRRYRKRRVSLRVRLHEGIQVRVPGLESGRVQDFRPQDAREPGRRRRSGSPSKT